MEGLMETNIAPGLRFSILDREFKKKPEECANLMGLTAVQLRVLGELSRLEPMGACEINQKDLEKALAVTHSIMTEIFNKICEGIPEEDIQTFLKTSKKMLENIEK